MTLSLEQMLSHMQAAQNANFAFVLNTLERIESMANLTQADLDGFRDQVSAYTADEKVRDQKVQDGLQSLINDIHNTMSSGNALDGAGLASALSALAQEHADAKPKEDALLAQVDALKSGSTAPSGDTVTTTFPHGSTDAPVVEPQQPTNSEQTNPPASESTSTPAPQNNGIEDSPAESPVAVPVEAPAQPAEPAQDPSVTPEAESSVPSAANGVVTDSSMQPHSVDVNPS